MKSLVFWGRGEITRARRRHAEGAQFLQWGGDRGASLGAAGVPFRTADLLPEQAEQVERAALRWARAWGRLPLVDGRSFRELYPWKETSLWALAESYWRSSPETLQHVRTVESLLLLLEAEAPDEVEAVGLPAETSLLLSRACTSRGILFLGREPRRRPVAGHRVIALAGRAQALADLARAAGGAVRRGPPLPPPAETPLVLLVAPATATPEAALVQIATVGLRSFVVCPHGSDGPGVPLRRFASGRVLAEVRAARRLLRQAWPRLRGSPGVHDAFTHRGVAFADLAATQLARLLLLALPRAVEEYEAVGEALRALAPAVVCLDEERRAALAACQATGTATVLLSADGRLEADALREAVRDRVGGS